MPAPRCRRQGRYMPSGTHRAVQGRNILVQDGVQLSVADVRVPGVSPRRPSVCAAWRQTQGRRSTLDGRACACSLGAGHICCWATQHSGRTLCLGGRQSALALPRAAVRARAARQSGQALTQLRSHGEGGTLAGTHLVICTPSRKAVVSDAQYDFVWTHNAGANLHTQCQQRRCLFEA